MSVGGVGNRDYTKVKREAMGFVPWKRKGLNNFFKNYLEFS
jgi:hypothetical protein